MMMPPPTPLEASLRAIADELRNILLKYAAAVGNLTNVSNELQKRDQRIMELESQLAEFTGSQPDPMTSPPSPRKKKRLP